MNKPNNFEHDAIVKLLPWYANGTLSPDEQALVDQHLPACRECQLRLAEYRRLDSMQAFSSEEATWRPSHNHFAGILHGLDSLEQTTATATPGWLGKLSAALKAIPSPAYWLMGAETVALAALILLVVARPPQQPQAQLFQTLSDARPPVAANLPRLSVVFAENITEKEIRELLQARHGQLVQGPSLLGVYTVQLAAGGEQELQQTISALRAHPKVKLVEAVAGTGRQ